jgi:hypothetical protein
LSNEARYLYFPIVADDGHFVTGLERFSKMITTPPDEIGKEILEPEPDSCTKQT